MFEKDVWLIWRYGDQREIKACIYFYNQAKYQEFIDASNKRYWLQTELSLPEQYFWNTYIDLDGDYFNEIDDEMKLDREVSEADSFVID